MLRRLIIITVGLLILTDTFGQNYSYEKIIETADSILKEHLDTHLLKYFSRDSGDIKYDFKRPNWRKYRITRGQIGKSEMTRGNFERTYIYYGFNYKEPMIKGSLNPGYLPGGIFMVFDSNLKLVEQLDFSFIPKYVKEQRPCDFITMDRAIDIAKADKIKDGLEPLTAAVDYDGNLKKYCWWVSTVLTREKHDDHIHGEADTVTIDATTGEIISHGTTYYGPLH